jgi:hypothetical protein
VIVVGLSGYAGAGKDSVADILVEDYGFTKMAFATALKKKVEILDPILGFHKEYCCENCDAEIEEVRLSTLLAYGMTQEEIKRDFMYGPELRRVWQYVGTDLFREDDEDYWVRIAFERLQEATAERVVFTDVRFENEAELIYNLRDPHFLSPIFARTSLWRIARPGVRSGGWEDHASEDLAGLLGEEVTILNDGSLRDLAEPVALAMDMLLNQELPGQQALDIDGWKWN